MFQWEQRGLVSKYSLEEGLRSVSNIMYHLVYKYSEVFDLSFM
jgi:hypothetical protein